MSTDQTQFSEFSPEVSNHSVNGAHRHVVQFYGKDSSFLLDNLARTLGAALGAGGAAIAVATPLHREKLAERLHALGINLSLAEHQGRYLALDAEGTLTRFMKGNMPDPDRFLDVIGGIVEKAVAASGTNDPPVAIFGEMVAILWGQKNSKAAIALELLWGKLAQIHRFSLHCAYPLQGFDRQEHGEDLQRICDLHSEVVPGEEYISQANEDERFRSIVLLQQKAEALKTEVLERKRIEQVNKEVEEMRLRLAAIVESSDDAIVSKNLHSIIISWNTAAEKLFGYTAEEMVGQSILKIIPPELAEEEDLILAKIRAGERLDHFETVRVTKDGERVDVSITVSPVLNREGKVIGAAKIARDITKRKKMEETLRISERLASVGRLAATVAHEINNPLEAVTNLVYLAKNQAADPQLVHHYLSMAQDELSRVSFISHQTLGFYREHHGARRVTLKEPLQQLVAMFSTRAKTKGIDIQLEIRSNPEIWAVAGEIRQLLANLLSNSLDALKSQGVIKIRVSSSCSQEGKRRPGVRITIADSGSGIPKENRRKIFEPFFTTKEDVGTGLGLWICHSIVTKLSGNVRLRSSTKPGRSWTIFSVFLPLQPELKSNLENLPLAS